MMREPAATTQSRQVRVEVKILTKEGFLLSLFECVVSWMQVMQGIAQGSLINVDSHGVVGERSAAPRGGHVFVGGEVRSFEKMN